MKYTLLPLLFCLCIGQSEAKMNFFQAFEKSSVGQCVELNFEGLALFSKISPSLFSGVQITFYVSPIIAHYNPDFLVTSYSRLGDSPLLESFATLGRAQNLVSKPLVELLTQRDVPESYGSIDQWGAKSTDTQPQTNGTLAYYETEVFGHPGNVYTWASKALRGELPVDGLQGGVGLLTVIPENIAQLPQSVTNAIESISANNDEILGQGFVDVAPVQFDPVAVATNAVAGELHALASSSEIGDAVQDIASNNPQGDATNFYLSRVQNSLRNQSNTASELVAGSDSTAGAVNDQIDNADIADNADFENLRLQISGLPVEVLEVLRAELGTLTPQALAARAQSEVDRVSENAAEVTALFRQLGSGFISDVQGLVTPGVSARPMPFLGFCPSDVTAFQPYYLSGTNVLAWRFKIPEIVYPQTYLPFSNQTTIGELFPGLGTNPLQAIAESHQYGSVYPRNGYLLQSDPVKAAAVTAFRAAHVVTRPNQPHIYRWAEPVQHEPFYEMDNGYDSLEFRGRRRRQESVYLQPHLDEKGRWQLIYNEGGEEDEQCHRFGSAAVNPQINGSPVSRVIGGVTNAMPPQWSENKTALNNDYIFSLWRRYRCAPIPSSGTLSRVDHIGNYLLPTPIEVIK